MKYKTEELKDQKNYFEINLSSGCFRDFKKSYLEFDGLSLDFDALNLGVKLYGEDTKQSKKIQKDNCKKVVKCYRLTKKFAKFLKRKKRDFDGTIYIKNLSKKRNNNDFMLTSMLTISEAKLNSRFEMAYDCACDFMDLESTMYDMCGFSDNQCAKDRNRGIKRENCCCPAYCKVRKPSQACPGKNISCKLYMCDYVLKNGYCFSPFSLAVLKVNYTLFEKFVCYGCHFKTREKAISKLRFIRIMTIVFAIMILLVIGLCFV